MLLAICAIWRDQALLAADVLAMRMSGSPLAEGLIPFGSRFLTPRPASRGPTRDGCDRICLLQRFGETQNHSQQIERREVCHVQPQVVLVACRRQRCRA